MKALKEQAEEKATGMWTGTSARKMRREVTPVPGQSMNVVNEAEGKTTCVVLMHDTKATKNTVKALPDIIDWFSENGYRFCGISELDQQI